MTTDTLIEEAMGEMHRLGIDNLRAKGAIVLLVEALRRAEAERDEARRDAEAVRAAAGYLTEETQQMAHLRASVAGQQKRAEQAEAELDAATTQLAKRLKRLEELERRCTQAESDRDELRATVTRLNRRAQTAEAGVRDNVEASKAAGVSMGRTLANAAAAMYRRRAEKAEAEREEARAQVWGLICAGSNMAERKQHFRGLWETALEAGLKLERKVSEPTATRDLLTAENARLQARVATLELLRRGGK